jgi:hypothetical protein
LTRTVRHHITSVQPNERVGALSDSPTNIVNTISPVPVLMGVAPSRGVSTISALKRNKWSWTMSVQMGRMLTNEHVEALLEGRVVISSLARMVARRKELD